VDDTTKRRLDRERVRRPNPQIAAVIYWFMMPTGGDADGIANQALWEDGDPALWEDGEPAVWEGDAP
jgi:hypothetical protein